MKNSLKSMNDTYKNIKINRHNQNYPKIDIRIKYSIEYNGIPIYFTTQEDVKKFIDDIKTPMSLS